MALRKGEAVTAAERRLSEKALEEVRAFARGRPEVAAVYLFGSEARGHVHRGSDVDLAVTVRGPLEGMARIEMETQLSNLLRRDVDLVVFGRAPSLLQHQILKYGRVIYEADREERVRQEVAARRDFLDTKFLHKEIWA